MGKLEPFVFVSYAHTDEKFAAGFAKRLRKEGINCFLDVESIRWGDHIPERIHEALNQATHLVVLMSPGSEESQWVAYETGYASARSTVLVPYLLHPRMKLPGFLSSRRYLQGQSDEEAFIKQLKYNIPREVHPGMPDKVPIEEGRVGGLWSRCISDILLEYSRASVNVVVMINLLNMPGERDEADNEALARLIEPLWAPVFQMLAILTGTRTRDIELGHIVIDRYDSQCAVHLTRSAHGFSLKFDEWASINAEFKVQDDNAERSIFLGHLDFYISPYADEGHHYRLPVHNDQTRAKLTELEPQLRKALRRLVGTILKSPKIHIKWEPLSWVEQRDNIEPDNVYWMTGWVR